MSPAKIQKALTSRAAWLKARLLRGDFGANQVGHAVLEKDAIREALKKLGLFDQEFYDEEIERAKATLDKRQSKEDAA